MRLTLERLGYAYATNPSQPVLDGISLEIESGEYWCVGGPNGSGKSTLLRLACGLLDLGGKTGSLKWDGREISSWTHLELAQSIAFVPNGVRTLFPVTTEDFVTQGRYARSRFWTRPSEADRARARSALSRVGIESQASRSLLELSAGQLQLALIARAIAQEPKMLVLDEATANLDLKYQVKIFELIAELNREGTGILIVCHDLNLAAEFCPNVHWLKLGSIYKTGSLEQTLTTNLMHELFEIGDKVEVGKNPFTSKPKIFWRQPER